ncbi:hypothetical protein F0562_033863 [Nyssa sinensis]|uniref:Uncharacterized protein n=1 Tax=Nyssa sinensis TaxID=561372 RepID=A0A5J5AGM4_9ASTE|nr:hypothetical protein F0562_033863 [Nyssa sinensis]
MEFVGKIVAKIIDRLFTSMGRQIGYVVHYKENIKNLKDEVDSLGNLRGRVQGTVDRAKDNGEVIEDDVSNWLSHVHEMEEAVKIFLENDNSMCFKGWSSDVRSRYRLGKEAKKKVIAVTRLKANGKFDTVAHRAPASDIWFKSTTDYENFESRRLIFKEIMEALRDDKIYIIGIQGAGGVGKTKMAEEIGKKAKENKLFDEVAMTSVSQNPDVRKIQGELADCLYLKLDSETEIGRAGQLCKRLQSGKKIIVIIDDVWKQINLKEVGIPFVDNIKGCKIVLTSRSSSVCHQMGVQKCVPIRFLSEHEAWALFKKKVKNSIDSLEMESIAKEVCRECAGLPLAILAVGGVLMNHKNKEKWEDALEQLKNSRLNNIEGMEVPSCIELSYKFLKSADLKLCFLLCCLFQENTQISIDDLVRYGVGMRFLGNLDTMEKARNRVHVLVDTLKTSSLLLEGRDENLVKMHDVIRDVAISIASKEEYRFLVTTGAKEWPEKDEYERCKVLSLWSKNIYELPDELECPELHTLVLDCNNPSLKVPNGFFNRMKKLNVLHLSNMHILSLPKLVNLRMLCLNNCKFVDMALLIKELPKLEILSLVDSSIKELEELAPEIRQLTHLRVLDLRWCNNLVIFPSHVISNLSHLEELCISDEFNGWEVETSKKKIRNASLVELNSLIQLIKLEIHIPNVMLLPEDLHFESLKRFKISVGKSFEFNSSCTRVLKLAGVPLKDEFNILMERTEELYLDNLEGLKKVLHEKNGEGFSELKYLSVKNCNDMNHLLSKPKLSSQYQERCSGPLCKLKVLVVYNCRLKYLFSLTTAKGLPQLQNLTIWNCECMEVVVRDDEEVMEKIIFKQLKKMDLQTLPNLRSFCDSMKIMSNMEGSPSNHGKAFFNEKIAFPVLEDLRIRKCGLKYMFSHAFARSFSQLQKLTIKCCEDMENIIENDEKVKEKIIFHQLKEMSLKSLPNLRSFYDSTKMRTTVEASPSNLDQALFNDKVAFPVLEVLRIWDLKNIRKICDNQSILPPEEESFCSNSFSKLSQLEVSNCGLKYMFSHAIARGLSQLQELTIAYCEDMENIVEADEKVEEKIIFHQLKEINLESLQNLRSFYDNTKMRTTVEASPSNHDQALFNDKVEFPCLEDLQIYKLDKVNEIWCSTVPNNSICKLRELIVQSCGSLEETPLILENTMKLKTMDATLQQFSNEKVHFLFWRNWSSPMGISLKLFGVGISLQGHLGK